MSMILGIRRRLLSGGPINTLAQDAPVSCLPARINSRPKLRNLFNGNQYGRRRFSLDTLSTILLPPAVFTALGLTLWAYKCVMMVIFQNRILYMPSVPPFSRSEKLEDYAQRCYPIKWEEQHIKSSDGTRISLINSGDISVGQSSRTDAVEDTHLLILYFQGNAGSLPPRTPYLADTLKTVSRFASKDGPPAKISLTAVSYRGFWTSKGRPSQKGIELDAAAALDWAVKKYSSNPKFRIVIWGASVGSGVSTTAVAAYREIKATNPIIKGLILETPFTNLSTLLQDFYPQRWLPYRYLTPFLRSHWDSKAALQRIAQSRADKRPSLLILQAGNDEVVPSTHGVELEAWCRTLNFDIEKKTIPALHTEIMTKSAGREEIAKYLLKFL